VPARGRAPEVRLTTFAEAAAYLDDTAADAWSEELLHHALASTVLALDSKLPSDVRMATAFIAEYLKKSGRLDRQHD
jgi:hypothetical protein